MRVPLKNSERNLEEIIDKACDVFGSDVTDYVVEWSENLTHDTYSSKKAF